MNDLQKCQFEMLKFFVKFCEDHDIKYFLVGGTALGAIRHGGFIPWDDDIDVGIPREDYDRFCEVAAKELNIPGSKYFLQTYETDPEYPYNFAKIRDNTTTFVEDNFMYCNMNQGVWIDVFPFDGLSTKDQYTKRELKKRQNTWYGFYFSYPRCLKHKIRAKHWWKDFWQNVFSIMFYWCNAKHRLNKRTDKIMRSVPFKDAKWAINIQGAIHARPLKMEYFQEGTKVKFEGVDMVIPKMYHEYLTALYGDYMTPPPPDKQIGMHFHKGLDLNTPWYEWKKDYRKW